jgi:hypothetical protein
MALQTSGFQVPASIRAPEIPSNIGKVDVKGIYDSVNEGLKSYEALRQMPAQQAADSSRLALATQKAEAEQSLIAPETAARKGAAARASMFNTPEMLQGEQAATQAQRDSILRKAAREQTELTREHALVQTAAAEEPVARAEILEAMKLADYDAKASALSEIRTKYPWMDLPQYKSLSGVLDTHYKSAMTERERAADREHAMELQAAKGETAVRVAGTRTDPKGRLLDRLRSLNEQIEEDPYDSFLKDERDMVEKQLNKTAAMEPLAPKTAAEDETVKTITNLYNAQQKAIADGNMKLAELYGNALVQKTLPRTTGTDLAARAAALTTALGVKPGMPATQVATSNAGTPPLRVVPPADPVTFKTVEPLLVTTRQQFDALPPGTAYRNQNSSGQIEYLVK